MVSINHFLFLVWSYQLLLIKLWEKEKKWLYHIEVQVWLVFFKMLWVEILKLWWFARYLLPVIIIRKLYQHLDMLIKLRKFKIKLLSMKVKLIKLFEIWQLKKSSFDKKSKNFRKCSKDYQLDLELMLKNYRNLTIQKNNYVTILKWWMTMQCQKHKNSKKKSYLNRETNLTSQNHIYQI